MFEDLKNNGVNPDAYFYEIPKEEKTEKDKDVSALIINLKSNFRPR